METLVLTSQQKIAISKQISAIKVRYGQIKGQIIAKAIPIYVLDSKTRELTPQYSENVQRRLQKCDEQCVEEIQKYLKPYGIKLEEGEFSFVEEGK